MSLPLQDIGAIDAGRRNRDADVVFAERRRRDVADLHHRLIAELCEDDCSHIAYGSPVAGLGG